MNEIVKEPFLRPNLENQGDIPPKGSIVSSPDIWCAGIHPIADCRKVLSQPDSYATMSEEIPVENMDNYFYVRCKNGADEDTDMQVQLYYANASLVCWPSDWKPIDVDNREDKINYIPSMKSGEIGVTEAPFVWVPPKRPQSDDGYCFIARLFSDKFSNPIPSGISPIHMASLIQNNLLWTEQNILKMTFSPNFPMLFTKINLNVPTNTSFTGNQWILDVESVKMDDWKIEVHSSRTDSDGYEIFLQRTSLKQQHIIVGNYNFQPGFFTELSILLYPNTSMMQSEEGAKLIFHLYYNVPFFEIGEAIQLKAFSPQHVERIRCLWKNKVGGGLVNPVLVGEYVIVIRPFE